MYNEDFRNEALKLVHEGKDILFTFKEEAELFMKSNDLKGELVENDMTDNDHYHIKGYKCNLYWGA